MRWLFALLLAATAAQAANIKVLKKENSDEPAVISIDGKIELEDDTKFEQLYAISELRNGHTLVYLKGPDGRVTPSINIGAFISQHELDTNVPHEIYCISACALAWLAGRTRGLGHNSRVGFHSTSIPLPGKKIRSPEGNPRAGFTTLSIRRTLCSSCSS